MIKRECLYEISDLKLAGKLEQMNDSQLEHYWRALNAFTEGFPEQEGELKRALAAKDYHTYSRCLSTIRDMLEDIHAVNIAADCQKHLNGITVLENIRHEKLVAFADYFLAIVSVLSIDIQMAEYKTQQDGADETAAGKAAAPADTQKTKKIILAVDDQPTYLTTIKSYLKDTEHKLVCTTSGADALKFLQNNRPDLFILDILMPEMDGIELAKKIRGLGQEAPIIFLTGSSTKESVVKALQAGGSDFIIKPATREQVMERVAKFI
jgi:CheY-like chemotaxis protein